MDDQWEAYWEAKERRKRGDEQQRIKRHRDNVRRMKQEQRRTPEWYEKKRETLARAWSRFHPMEMTNDKD